MQTLKNYVFCYKCNKIYPGDNVTETIAVHPEHDNEVGVDFLGVLVKPDFITFDEENALITGIDSLPWDVSQSGRRKQVSIILMKNDRKNTNQLNLMRNLF